MKKSRKRPKKITAEELDRISEEGKEDLLKYFDTSKAKWVPPVPPGTTFTFRINIDFPSEMLEKVDKEAARIGIARAALIKMWIAERVDKLAS